MNKKLKGFLCRNFSDDEKVVTLASILKYTTLYILLAIIILIGLYCIYSSLEVIYVILYICGENCGNLNDLPNVRAALIGFAIDTLLIIEISNTIYEYLSKIEITRCEKN